MKGISTVLLVSPNEGPEWINALVSSFTAMNRGAQNDMGTFMWSLKRSEGGEEVALEVIVTAYQAVFPSFPSPSLQTRNKSCATAVG